MGSGLQGILPGGTDDVYPLTPSAAFGPPVASRSGAWFAMSDAALYTVSNPSWMPATNYTADTPPASWTAVPGGTNSLPLCIGDDGKIFFENNAGVVYYDGTTSGQVASLISSLYQKQVVVDDVYDANTNGQALFYGVNEQTNGDWVPNWYLATTTNGAGSGASGTWPVAVVTPDTNWGVYRIDAMNASGILSGEAVYNGTNASVFSGGHGVLLVPAEFKLRNDTNIFQGWDGLSSSSSGSAWTEVGVGATNQLTKLTLPDGTLNGELECVVDDTDGGYSAGCISISSMTLATGDNNISITGIAKTTATPINNGDQTTSIPARIVLRLKATKQVLLALNVIVEPSVNITIDIFYTFDPSNTNSMLPSGFPQSLTDTATASTDSANIISKLNGYYNKQANVFFSLGSSYLLTPSNSPALTTGDFNSSTGIVDFNPQSQFSTLTDLTLAGQILNSSHHIKLFIVKGVHATAGPISYLAVSEKPDSFVPALTTLNLFYITCGHEIGRDLDLSSVDAIDKYRFDYGPWPIEFMDDGDDVANETGLLSNNSGPQTPWIRHEDSQEANNYATNSGMYH